VAALPCRLAVLCGPQGAGKTSVAVALRKLLGLTRIVDEWDGRAMLRDGDLAVTNATDWVVRQ